MTPPPRPSGLGYESPTEQNAVSALAANNLIHRLNELERRITRRDEAKQQHQRQHPETVDEAVSKTENYGGKSDVSIKDRIACFQWTWFTSTMATGGIANVMASSELSVPGPVARTTGSSHRY